MRWIEEERKYGKKGQPLENLMRRILEDWAPGTELVVPRSPGFLLKGPYRQGKMSVQDALQRLAALIGWVITVREIEGRDRLVFIDPGRKRTETVWTFGPSDYFRPTAVSS